MGVGVLLMPSEVTLLCSPPYSAVSKYDNTTCFGSLPDLHYNWGGGGTGEGGETEDISFCASGLCVTFNRST